MKTKNIFKAVACAMLMPTMLLTTACSSEDDLVNNTAENTEAVANKGYALPVTVNVTRQDDGTRATYNESTKKLEFSDGDNLFVKGNDNSVGGAGQFAGELNYVSEGTFSGTIYTEKEYSGTADALFTAASAGSSPECYVTATLLPNGYDANSFLDVRDNFTIEAWDDVVHVRAAKTFVASETAKVAAVEQFSWEQAINNYSSGFALTPSNAILNFTISGLEAGAKDVTLTIKDGYYNNYIHGSVTPNASGVATFAIGVPNGSNISSDFTNNLTVGTHNFTFPSSTKFTAGKIYNITRDVNAINGKFTINSSGDQVYFAKGNLRYVSGTWSFFDHQYDCYNTYSADAWDKFGWSTSSTTYGMSTSETSTTYSGDFVDWGTVPGIGEGWYTLSHEEWNYLFNTRTDATSKYGYATVNDVHGIIILPDAFVDPKSNKSKYAFVGSTTEGWDANVYTAANWTLMEARGAVFLPAAGYRIGASVNNVSGSINDFGEYWSSSASGGDEAYRVALDAVNLDADDFDNRRWGMSVRLVRQVK